MNNYSSLIRSELNRDDRYRDRLYCRNYILTNIDGIEMNEYPFYGRWNKTDIGDYCVLTHPKVHSFAHRLDDDASIVLIGHALNPFQDEIDENVIIERLGELYFLDHSAFLDALDELTGVFVLFVVRGKNLFAVQDPGGQKMLYFGKVRDRLVITSTPQLAADVFGLQPDTGVERILNSKGYYRGSGFLPGNLSPYTELKRLGPNTSVTYKNGSFLFSRIFPREERMEVRTEAEKQALTEQMHRLFSKNLELTIQKWDRVALSLTGGMDSQTTFANAKPWWDRLFVYSFISKPSEKLDADAAADICAKLGVSHHLYQIPENADEIEDYDFLEKVIEQNTSNICKINPNEKRKYIWLERKNDFDVEIKSDMSEVGRAYTERKYKGVKVPRKMAPRHLTIGQARYFLEPWGMRFADRAYRSFMEETGLTGDLLGYSMHDLVYWEVRMGAWASTSFASQEYFHEIMIPYNNRRLLAMFLRFPESDRKQDLPHKRLMKSGSPELAHLQVQVKDSYMGMKRMAAETLYYYYATRLNLKK